MEAEAQAAPARASTLTGDAWLVSAWMVGASIGALDFRHHLLDFSVYNPRYRFNINIVIYHTL